MIAAIYFVALVIFSGVQAHQHSIRRSTGAIHLWNPQLFLGVALGTLAIVSIGSSYKTMALAGRRQRGFRNDGRAARQFEHDRS